MEKQVILTESMPWKEWEGFPSEIGVKVLRDEDHCGARTLLVNIPPKAEVPSHSHRSTVQHYVIQGMCEIDGKEFAAGTFSLMPAHSDIPPIRSRDGAVILMIYEPVGA
jgi:hypothetical protein